MRGGRTGSPGGRAALYGLPLTVAAAMLGAVLVANPAEYGAGGVVGGLALAGVGLVSSLRLFRMAGRGSDDAAARPSRGADDREMTRGSAESATLKQGDAGL